MFRKISTFSSVVLIGLLMQESIPGWDGVRTTGSGNEASADI